MFFLHQTSPVVKRESPSPLGVARNGNGGSTLTSGFPVTTLPAPTPIHPTGPVLIKPKPEMPAKPKVKELKYFTLSF